MADTAAHKRKTTNPGAKSSRPAQPAAEDDGGLRAEDRERLKALMEARRGAAKGAKSPSRKPKTPAKTQPKTPAKTRAAAKSAQQPETQSETQSETRTARKASAKAGAKAGTKTATRTPSATRRAAKPAAKTATGPSRESATRNAARPRSANRASHAAAPTEPRPKLLALHRILLDRLGNNPERVSTAARNAPDGSANGARVSPRKLINWALDMLPAEELPYLTFVDLGSGRGRVVMEAARRDFEHIIGVEKDPALHEDAAINLRHWPRSIMQCRDVDLVCADVEKWKWPRQDLVMYVFLDFSERAMMNLYARFNRHVQDGHRLYLVMIDRTGRMPLNESPYFAEIEQPAEIARMVRWFSPYDFQVYQSHEPETEIIWDKHRKPRRRARS